VDLHYVHELRKIRDDLAASSRSPIELVREAVQIIGSENSEAALTIRGVESEIDDVPSDGTPSLWDPDAYQTKRSECERYLASCKSLILESLQQVIDQFDPPKDLNSCIERWIELVAEIRKGYGRYIEEYDNDVSIRSIIERLLLNNAGDSALRDRLAAADREFIEWTYEDEMRSRSTKWCNKRLPLIAVHNLRNDLDSGLP